MSPPKQPPVAVPLHGITVIEFRISASVKTKKEFRRVAPHLYVARCRIYETVDIADTEEDGGGQDSGSGAAASSSFRPKPGVDKPESVDEDSKPFKV